MGKRLMKTQNILDEVEKCIEDKLERTKVLDSSLGQILSSTQVLISIYIYI